MTNKIEVTKYSVQYKSKYLELLSTTNNKGNHVYLSSGLVEGKNRATGKKESFYSSHTYLTVAEAKELAEILPEFIKKIEEEQNG